MKFFDVLEEFKREKNCYHLDGESGVRNLCRIVNGMGYKDSQNFGQFQGACYGDLIIFLEDNSGCLEAIENWIVEQNVDNWKDNLESYLPEREEEVEDDN